jgi:hypothetical protein
MKSNNKGTSRKLATFLLPMLLVTPAVQAVGPTHWAEMNGNYEGSIAITANSGKQVKGTGSVFFAPGAVTFAGVSYLRGDVKEVVIRRPRTVCCEPLGDGVLPTFQKKRFQSSSLCHLCLWAWQPSLVRHCSLLKASGGLSPRRFFTT